MMKKLAALCVAVTFILSALAMPAYAYSSIQKPGEYVGEADYTDIVTYVNHYAIPSWIVNGYPMVAVEDLDKYGLTFYGIQLTVRLEFSEIMTRFILILFRFTFRLQTF